MARPSADLFEYKDGVLYWKVKSTGRGKNNGKVGYVDSQGYCRMKYNGTRYFVHRLVWEFHYGAIPEGLFIDHINGDREDNRIENLRLVTTQQNQFNRKKEGVSWCKTTGKWKASIFIDGQHLNTKRFCTHEEAKDYRLSLEETYHKEFAYGRRTA